ncbi:unnamed protein product [Adineta ricciae]|uniref:Uncharacterized protein n=1 Tax=Adineta ricciae TaxID=249248 RepID=A0A815ST31_ADIRI|nr:unnamed protein product [Adineta ricciae]
MSWLKELWERLFHWSNITYIANAYGHDIWIAVKSNDLELNHARLGVVVPKEQETAPIGFQLERTSDTGWIKLTRNKIHRHNRSSKTERITVVRANTLEEVLAAVAAVSKQVAEAAILEKIAVTRKTVEVSRNATSEKTTETTISTEVFGIKKLTEALATLTIPSNGASAVVEPNEAPAVAEPNEAPAVAEPNEAPAVAEPNEAPAVVEPNEAPAVVEPNEAPAVAEPNEAPAVAEPNEAPAVVEPNEAPAVVEPNEAPAVVKPNEAAEVLVFNYEIQQNYSYVVTGKGEFLQQKYGSNNLFQDFTEHCHRGTPPASDVFSLDPYLCLSALLGTSLFCFVFRHRIVAFFTPD